MNEKQKNKTVQILVDGDLADSVKNNFAGGRPISITQTVNHLLDMLNRGMVNLQALNPLNSDKENK